jgi:hypothetical protein
MFVPEAALTTQKRTKLWFDPFGVQARPSAFEFGFRATPIVV